MGIHFYRNDRGTPMVCVYDGRSEDHMSVAGAVAGVVLASSILWVSPVLCLLTGAV